MPGRVRLEGLSELRTALRGADDTFRAAALALRTTALGRVHQETKRTWPYVTGATSATIKLRKASVSVTHPAAGWLEFGGTRGRPYQREGRWLFPSAHREGPRYESDIEKLLNAILKQKDLT